MRFLLHALMLVLVLVPLQAQARLLVLIHGYLSDGHTWEQKGVIGALAAHGWQFAGDLVVGGITRQPAKLAENRIYVANLPFTAPLMWQSDRLEAQLNLLRNAYPDDTISLVSHSAGGVVARLALVRFGAKHIDQLITIGAPHLGTPLTHLGIDVTNNHGPFEIIKHAVGGESYKIAKLSRGLYKDLLPPRPGTLLYWLNAQQHPAIKYISIVRSPLPGADDAVVPTSSQDMNNVPALYGQSTLWKTPAPHYLRQADGILLAQLLSNHGQEKRAH